MTTHKLVPVEPTEAMQRAAIRAGYIHVGATPEEAEVLAERKFAKEGQIEFGSAQWRGAFAAAPNEGRVSREHLTKACDAALAAKRGDGVNGGGTNAITYAVIAALGLEIEGE